MKLELRLSILLLKKKARKRLQGSCVLQLVARSQEEEERMFGRLHSCPLFSVLSHSLKKYPHIKLRVFPLRGEFIPHSTLSLSRVNKEIFKSRIFILREVGAETLQMRFFFKFENPSGTCERAQIYPFFLESLQPCF